MSPTGLMRLIVGIPLAAAVVLALFILMRNLILTEGEPPDANRSDLNIEFLQSKTDTEVVTRNRRPDEPEDVRTPPPPPRIEAPPSEAPQEGLATTLGQLPELSNQSLDTDIGNIVVADRDEQPLVRGEQEYPARALERGLNGTCVMRFDVNPDGTTTNISVARCSDSVFERAAVRAVERYRYAPRIVDGQAVVRRGLQIELVWEIAE